MSNPPDRSSHPKRKMLDSAQLNAVADQVRAAGGKGSTPAIASVSVHTRPALGNVHMAYEGGHISLEEAQDLNPKYDPSKKRQNQINAIQQRNNDKNPIGEKAKRREFYVKKKGKA